MFLRIFFVIIFLALNLIIKLALNNFLKLTLTLSAWPLRSDTALKSILWEALIMDQLHDFSLSS